MPNNRGVTRNPCPEAGAWECTCVGCGCTDSCACAGGCSWGVSPGFGEPLVSRAHRVGVCTNCVTDANIAAYRAATTAPAARA